MSQQRLLDEVLDVLDRLEIEYMITGSWASSLQGQPRSTHDLDLLVALEESDVGRLHEALAAPNFYLDRQSMQEAVRAKSMFNLLDTRGGDKVDFWLLTEDPWDASRFARRESVLIPGGFVGDLVTCVLCHAINRDIKYRAGILVRIDVTLPLEQTPRFPDLCVGCGRPHSTRHVRVRTLRRSFFMLPISYPFFVSGIFTAVVPCCDSCQSGIGRRLRIDLVWRLVLTVIVGYPFAYIIYLWKRPASFTGGILTVLDPLVLIALLCAIVLIYAPLLAIGDRYLPPFRFGMLGLRRHVIYEFGSLIAAKEFARVNHARLDDSVVLTPWQIFKKFL